MVPSLVGWVHLYQSSGKCTTGLLDGDIFSAEISSFKMTLACFMLMFKQIIPCEFCVHEFSLSCLPSIYFTQGAISLAPAHQLQLQLFYRYLNVCGQLGHCCKYECVMFGDYSMHFPQSKVLFLIQAYDWHPFALLRLKTYTVKRKFFQWWALIDFVSFGIWQQAAILYFFLLQSLYGTLTS